MNIINLYRGDDKVYELTVTNRVTGAIIDITNCTIKWTWKVAKTDAAYFLQKTANLTDPSNGKAEFTIDAADTSSLTAQQVYCWDVEVTKTTAKKETLCTGKVIVHLDVTV